MSNHFLKEQHILDLGGKVLEQIELKNSFKDKFNIFKTLGIERKEVDLHSKFLYELLNPYGCHNQGKIYLELFIKQLTKRENIDLSKVQVTREHVIQGNRRIDFVIKNVLIDEENITLLIEMKIDASDQPNQLKDYDVYGQGLNSKYELFYLTLDGSEASEESTGCEELEYKKISFEGEILKFIEKSIEKSSTIPSVRETLAQYRKTILDICSEPEEEDKKIMKEFLLEKDNLKIIDELSKAIPEAKFEIELKFWNELKEGVEKELKNYNFSLDEVYSKLNRNEIKNMTNNKWLPIQLYYVYEEKFNKNIFNIGIETSPAEKDFYFFFQVYDNDDEVIGLKNIKEELLEKLRKLSLEITEESEYLYKYCDTDFQYGNEGFYSLQDKIKREKIIGKLKNGLLEIAKYIDGNKSEIGEILERI